MAKAKSKPKKIKYTLEYASKHNVKMDYSNAVKTEEEVQEIIDNVSRIYYTYLRDQAVKEKMKNEGISV